MLASAPENAGWETGLSSVIAAYASPLPYHLLCSDPDMPDVQTFPTALALVEHLRRIYGKAAMSSSERRRPDEELEADAADLLRESQASNEESMDEDENSDAELWDEQVAALQGERILLEPSAGDSSSSSSSSSSASSASPALLATLLPLQEPFLVFFQGDLAGSTGGGCPTTCRRWSAQTGSAQCCASTTQRRLAAWTTRRSSSPSWTWPES